MPIEGLQRRHRELGRVRMGAKGVSEGGKSIPVKLDTWRLTSPSLELLHAASQLWGGTVGEWKDAPTQGLQYELITEAREIPVLVPPQVLEDSQWYTLYSGGGIERKCDGRHATIPEGDCLCDPENRACQVTTNLLVVLHALPDIGVWRLVSHGYNAAAELSMGVEILMQFMGRGGMPEAVLGIEARTSKNQGQTRHFLVPVLKVPHSLEELAAGEGQRALGSGGMVVDTSTGEILVPVPGGGTAAVAEDGEASEDRSTPPLLDMDDDGEGVVHTPVLGRVPGDRPLEPDTDEPPADTSGEGGDRASAASAPSPDVDTGELAGDKQWALLDRHQIPAGRILTKAREMFGDEIRSKSDITKWQFAKVFAEVVGRPGVPV
jgi:hypothetical protein